ncbi:MAG: 3-phosphoshikimate 1-carboxyvinyltransferase [Candidatus Micrarchaeota archaeon]
MMMNEVSIILKKTDGNITGTVTAPPSKSYTHRAIICGALAKGKTIIKNALICEDTLATIEACRKLGAKIETVEDCLEVDGTENTLLKDYGNRDVHWKDLTIDCKESGSTLRFMIPLCTLTERPTRIIGKSGLLKRPTKQIVESLTKIGVSIHDNDGVPPVKTGGGLKGGRIEVAGNVSSQFISGLLFALPLAKEKSEVVVTTDVESKNYIEMTLDILNTFDISVVNSADLKKFLISPNQSYKPKKYAVEGDYSSGAFLLALGILASDKGIYVKGLEEKTWQGDAEFARILKRMGAEITFQKGYRVAKSHLNGCEIDAKNILDLVPILCVVATQANGKTIIRNIERLKIKECNRAAAIISELRKMGADIVEKENAIEVVGPTKLKGAVIDPHNDHRIAMACSVASLIADGETIILDPTCIKKSYPEFYNHLRRLGVEVTTLENSFGKKFKIQTYGDSHGKKIGVLIDGCPKGIGVSIQDIQNELDKRRSYGELSTPRKEEDKVTVLSGIENGVATGSVIRLEILNMDTHSKSYESIRNSPRPGHADYTAFMKYGSVFDYRGGGFLSGRMTACMAMAGAIAKKILSGKDIAVNAYARQIGKAKFTKEVSVEDLKKYKGIANCPFEETSKKMIAEIENAMKDEDSVGGIVECRIDGVPMGIGEPIFNSIESIVSHAMFSIPAVKGIEFGSGFSGSGKKGSENNDPFVVKDGEIQTKTNNAGGILGGISNGMSIIFRVAIKPTSSIGKEQDTVDLKSMKNAKIKIIGRHDPCIVVRVPVVVEAMAAIALAELME